MTFAKINYSVVLLAAPCEQALLGAALEVASSLNQIYIRSQRRSLVGQARKSVPNKPETVYGTLAELSNASRRIVTRGGKIVAGLNSVLDNMSRNKALLRRIDRKNKHGEDFQLRAFSATAFCS
jgi:hypothetical protein